VVAAGTQSLVLEAATTVPVPTEVEKGATKKLGVFGWLAIIWVVGIVLAAVLVPVLPVPSPSKSFPDLASGPTGSHILGTDGNGQDLLSRVIWGARASLLISSASILLGLIGGGILGLIAGYYGGKIDTVLTNMFNVFLAIPQLVLALALVAVFASDPATSSNSFHWIITFPVSTREFWLIVSIGLVSIPIIGRITRGATLAWSQREFVLAARSMGAKNKRIMIREVFPNVAPAMFSIALLGIAVVIVLEGGLSILGVGVPPSTPSWGNLVATGRNELIKIVNPAPQVILAPSIAIFLTVLSLNYLGDVVRARFDVRESAI
jgi:peptide/nickel transport system permease protein